MTTYKLLRVRHGKLYPMFVERQRETPMGQWLKASIGELADSTHVKSPGIGKLSLRPGWHSCTVPFTDWIGKKQGGTLVQRKDTVWCECEVDGEQVFPTARNGLRTIPEGWYYFRTKPGQPFPWIISDRIRINRILSRAEVEKLCRDHGVEAQRMEDEI